ncbi:MAG: hypothetical protein JWS12_891 [Candidatus Saccharibacteria bacterium]|nr:hypothetical protein [Candidatus Saccharibacteria bacterium]
METLQNTDHLPVNRELFMRSNLELLAQNLPVKTYPGYPGFNERLFTDAPDWEPPVLPLGLWETSGGQVPTIPEQLALANHNLRFDSYGRPLHPWFDDMVSNPNIGVVTGKGFYRNWGPNYTGDPIIIRRDLEVPHVLLIKRRDTGAWALPGGFVDPGENGLRAAMREAREEANLDLEQLEPSVQTIYQGPVADLRATANAWPETTAVRFELDNETVRAQQFEMYSETPENPEVEAVSWFSTDSLDGLLFGSHRVLIQLALGP